jgi:hypothetical protein
MARRYYSSIAARTALAAAVNPSTTTFIVDGVQGWPSSFPYTLIIDEDTINEEIVEVTGRSSTTLTVTRGRDGTSGVAHSAGATVRHGVSARDFDEPNAFINGTGVVTEALLASGAVTEAKLGTGAVTSAKILDNTIVDADVNASAAIAQSKIANLTSDLGSKLGTTVTTKGDLITYGTAPDRLAVGTNGQVLTADSDQTLGVKWADNAAAPGAWTTWTPTYTQTGSLTTSAASARYSQIGKIVTAHAEATFSNSGTTNTSFLLTNLPVTAASTGTRIIGHGVLFDSSTSINYSGHLLFVSSTEIRFVGDWSGSLQWGFAPNLAIASGDVWRFSLMYEAS